MREHLESDGLSQMELEHELVSGGALAPRQEPDKLHLLGGVVSPEVSRYFAVLLFGWLSMRVLEIGCGGGIASVHATVQPNPVLYVANEEEDAPVSAFISGSDLSFGGHPIKSAGTAFAPIHFPAVPVSSLLLSNVQSISMVEILAPTVPLPPDPSAKTAPPAPPSFVSVQLK